MDTTSANNNQGPQPQNKPLRKARRMPSVEGINAPRGVSKEPMAKISLTPQEQDLISETSDSPKSAPGTAQKNNQRILPQSLIDRMEKKPTHYKAIFSIFIILLVLTAGGYEFYIYYVDRHVQPVQTTDLLNIQPYSGLSVSTTPDTILLASTTPANASTTIATGTVATTTVVSAPTPTPAPQLTINKTPTGYLNVRSQPSTGASVLTQVHPGESYPYSQTQNGWYQITLTNGTIGWVSGQYVTQQ